MVKHDTVYNYTRPGPLRRYSDWALPILVFIAALGIYLRTMAPSIFWDDSAAFTASNFILGLPHSPSFPLYTLLGRLFVLIPDIDPAFAANLMSAFFASLSVMLFFILMKQFAEVPILQSSRDGRKLGNRSIDFAHLDKEEERRLREVDTISKPAIVILPCLAATALFAISLPVWLAAVRAEVYSLHLFLTLLSAVIIFKGVTEGGKRLFYLGIWLYALTFANHPLLALAFAPGFLYLILINFSNIGFRPATLSLMALFFVASFSIYLYLPIRSALEPAINWGRPDNLDSFLAAITRSSDLANFSQMTIAPDYMMRLRQIGAFMATQIGWPLVGLVLLGFWGIFKISRKLFLFFPLAILGNLAVILWAADFNPRNYDLINYLAPLTALILVVSCAGFLYLIRVKIVATQAALFMTVLIGFFIYLAADNNHARADFSRVNGPEVLCQEALKDLPPDALLIVAEDDLLLPLWYSAYVDSSAAKISIISDGALVNPQYRKQLTVNYPKLIYPVGFTSDSPGQSDSLTAALCRLNAPSRDVYIQFGAPGISYAEIEPSGILFKYIGQSRPPKVDKESHKIHMELARKMLEGNPSDLRTIDFAGRWLFNIGVYFDRVNNSEIAWQLFNRALNVDKGSIDMRIRLAAGLAKAGKLKDALQYISQALEIDPNDKNSLELGRHIIKALEKQGAVAAND